MTQDEIKALFAANKTKVLKSYEAIKQAYKDGFDPEDITVTIDEVHKLYLLLESFNETVTLEDKKAFVLVVVDDVYATYEKELPWYVRMLPFKSVFIKKQMARGVGKLLDLLVEKGLIK